MTQKQQKRTELRHLFDFKSIIPEFPEGSITISEKPDFIIHSDGCNIGIETTRIFLNSNKTKHTTKQQDSEKILLLEKARDIYDSMKMPPVNVSVNFISDIVFNRKKQSSLPLTLAKYVALNLPSYNGFFHYENSFDSSDVFPNEIDSLIIGRFGDEKSSFFNWSLIGWIHEDCHDEIQKVITDKDVLLRNYQKCDSNWLLIVADWTNSSSFIQPSEESLNKLYRSSFDRVLFLNCYDRVVVELKIK